jgi:predicted DNA-binding protein (MmcQ/YjbR family)
MSHKKLDKLCLGWPGVTVDIKWGADRCYCVAAKMFLVTAEDSKTLGRLTFKVPDELFLALTEQPGVEPAPYLARAKWVEVTDAGAQDWKWLEQQIRRSYELIRDKLPKKVRDSL